MELRLLLQEAVVLATGRWPLLRLCLYVDDLTIVAAGTSFDALQTVSRATDFFVRVFESVGLQVSTTKSFAVAARPKLANKVGHTTDRRVLQPRRSVKLLGVPFAGGRRRSVDVIQKRLKNFRGKVPRIHLLRRQRIDTTRMVNL